MPDVAAGRFGVAYHLPFIILSVAVAWTPTRPVKSFSMRWLPFRGSPTYLFSQQKTSSEMADLSGIPH